MKLILRIFFYLIVTFLILMVGASIALHFILNPNVLKSLISTQVQNYTGRTITIGKLDYNLFPTFRLELNDVALSNDPKFGSTPFMTLNEVNVGVKILPLLHNEIILTGITVDGIQLNLTQNDTNNNWQGLSSSKSDSKKPIAKTSSPSNKNSYLDIPFINLQNLNINYQNGANLTQLKNLYFTAKDIRNNQSFFSFNAGSNISQSTPLLNVNWQLSGQASIAKDFMQYQLKNVDISGQIISQKLQKKFAMTDLQTTIKISPTQILIQPLSASLYSGQLAGHATVNLQSPSSYQLTMSLQGVALKALLSDLDITKKISGQINAQTSIATQGQGSKQLMQNLSGNGSFNISQVQAEGVDIGKVYKEALALIQNKQSDNSDLGNTSKIGNLTGTFNIANGILNTQDTQFISPVFRANVTGTANIPTQKLNFVANVTPVRGSLDDLKDNGPTIPFDITGSFTKPKATPNVGKLIKTVMKDRMDNELKKFKKHLPNLGDSLKGIF